ncbi:uncharacterized protein LOC115825257 isoform X2 [Chanos chanos]|nr:uncharacterized protein LOC115825257 isoform X2 [Chanos chanos]
MDLKHYLDYLNLDEPIIGLSSVMELENAFSDDGQRVLKYKCRMCRVEGDLPSMTSHLVGRKHRQKYLEAKRPDLVTWNDRAVAQPGLVVRAKAAVVEKQEGQGIILRRSDLPPLIPPRKAGSHSASSSNVAGKALMANRPRELLPRGDMHRQSHTDENIHSKSYWKDDTRKSPYHYPEDDILEQRYQQNDPQERTYMEDDLSVRRYPDLHGRSYLDEDVRGIPYSKDDMRRMPYQDDDDFKREPYPDITGFPRPEEELRARPPLDVDLRARPHRKDDVYAKPHLEDDLREGPYLNSDRGARTYGDDDIRGSAYPAELGGGLSYDDEEPYGRLYVRGGARGNTSVSYDMEEPEMVHQRGSLSERDLRGPLAGATLGSSGLNPREADRRMRRDEDIKDGMCGLYKGSQRVGDELSYYSRNFQDEERKREYVGERMGSLEARGHKPRPPYGYRDMQAEYPQEQAHAKRKRKSRFSDATAEEIALAKKKQLEELTRDDRKLTSPASSQGSSKRMHSRDISNVNPGNVLDILNKVQIENISDANFLREKLCSVLKEFQANKAAKKEQSHGLPIISKDYNHSSNIQMEEQQQQQDFYDEDSRMMQGARHFQNNPRDSQETRHYEEIPRSSQQTRYYEEDARGTREARHYEDRPGGSSDIARRYTNDLREEARHYERFDGSSHERAYRGRSTRSADQYEDANIDYPDNERSSGYRGDFKEAAGFPQSISQREDQWMYGERPRYHRGDRPGDEIYDPFHPSSSPPREVGNSSSLSKIASALLELVARK